MAKTVRLGMPILILTFNFLLFLFFHASAQTIDDWSAHSPVADPNSILIQVDAGQDGSAIESALLEQGLTLQRTWPEFGLAQVRIIDDGSALNAAGVAGVDRVAQTMQLLSTVPGVHQVGPDLRIVAADRPAAPGGEISIAVAPSLATGVPSDTLYPEQWTHAKMGVAESWQINQGNPALAIAVIDSGYDLLHEDLSLDALWVNAAEQDGLPGVDDDSNGFVDDIHGWDWIENDDIANDPYGHGTHVGGTIAATTNNSLGIAGVGLQLRILPLRVLDEQGSGQISDLIDAIYYAHQKDIRVANLSLVLQFDSDMLRVAIEKANEGGMIIAAASGNSASEVYWPAKYPQTIAVAATDSNDLRGAFSNHGPEIDIAAPGSDILSTFRDNSYERLSGTSMATAHVSALAGLILSLQPDLSTEQLADLIRSSAVDVNGDWNPGFDEYLGHGRIDFQAALLLASSQLIIRPASDSQGIVLEDQALVLVSVEDASTTAPASGAVVQYELITLGFASVNAVDQQTQILSGVSATDEEGIASIAFTAPAQGDYRLRLQVGRAVAEMQLIVRSGAAAVQLGLPVHETVVGAQALALAIDIDDHIGQPVSDGMPLHLETNLGRFPNGERQYDLVVTGGNAAVPFEVGQVAGVASITARVGALDVTDELLILPGPAASINISDTIQPISNWAGADETSICLAIVDEFGNAVSDETQVKMYADRGTLTESVLSSLDGSVATTLVVPMGVDGVAHIWAVASGTDAHAQVDVPVMGHAVWLPLLFAD